MTQMPTLTLSPRNRARQTLRQWIDRGVLRGGQPLPSERALGKQLGVSQTVVRNVLRELVEDALIVDEGTGRRSVRVESDITKASSVDILRSTIVLLTPFGEPSKDHKEPGWVEHRSMGALAGSQMTGRDVMVIHPDRLAAGGVGRLLKLPPMGVIVPEPERALPGQDLKLHRLAAAGIPVVVYGDWPDLTDFDRVLPDHEGGTYELTRWVIAQGRRRIVNLTGNTTDTYWYQNRMRGYERAMLEAGLQPLSPELFTGLDSVLPDDRGPRWSTRVKFDIERHQLAGHIAQLLCGSDPVDAIMLGNDGQAIVAAAALRLLGREPGKDVLLVGYDNMWAGCIELRWEPGVPAATVDKCNSQIGRELVRLLMDRVEGRLPPDPQRRVVPSQLVVIEQDTAAQGTGSSSI